ncbi:MAG TPA: cytochrome c [Gammaproteobacteria bacterium]
MFVIKMKLISKLLMLSLVLLPLLAYAQKNNAEEVYFQTCIICHGDDGSGSMPGVPDLADSKSLFVDKNEVILARLKAGIQTQGNVSMPPKGGNPDLTDDQLLEVLLYLKELVKGE